MRSRWAAWTAALLSALLVSCGDSEPDVGYSVSWIGATSGTWAPVVAGMEAHSSALGVAVTTRSDADQAADIRAAVAAGDKAIVLLPHKGRGPTKAIQEALDAGVSVLVLTHQGPFGTWARGGGPRTDGVLVATRNHGTLKQRISDQLPMVRLHATQGATPQELLARPEIRSSLHGQLVAILSADLVESMGTTAAKLRALILEAVVKAMPDRKHEIAALNEHTKTVVLPGDIRSEVGDVPFVYPGSAPVPLGTIVKPRFRRGEVPFFCEGQETLAEVRKALDEAPLAPPARGAAKLIGLGTSESMVNATAGTTQLLVTQMMPGSMPGVLPLRSTKADGLLVADGAEVGLVALRFLLLEMNQTSSERPTVMVLGRNVPSNLLALTRVPRAHLSELWRSLSR